MGKTLVIVESPTKAKTISKFLGSDYIVESSFGHIRDLPKSKLGIDVEHNFEPQYQVPQKAQKNVTKLKSLAKNADEIILATDEDREGEAIAMHLVEALGLKEADTKRIVFHEITKSAIEEALKSPRTIDDNLVDAQQARRVLDRLVGYTLSPLLWKKVYRGLSAGRVQSVAVRLIVEREREIQAFIPQEYWSITGQFEHTPDFEAFLYAADGKKLDKFAITNEDQALKITENLRNQPCVVSSVTKKEKRRKQPTPFTTSTLQQEASRKLGFSAKQTMMIAQQLYEGIEIGGRGSGGLITYMRTDSLNLSGQAVSAIRDYIGKNYPTALPEKPIFYKTKKKGAQEAHEAIRPTDVTLTPQEAKGSLDDRQLKLYTLIWQRSVACQMKPAVFDATTIDISAGEYTLRANGSVMKFPSFLSVYPAKIEETELPELSEGDALVTKDIIPQQHFTQPPGRYSEATLIKVLEEYGIGRPSTYAPTISTILARSYVEKQQDKKLHPTDLGIVVNDFLVKHFPDIVDYEFTAEMEEKLDTIAEGGIEWQPVIKAFYEPFQKHIIHLEEHAERETGERKLGTDPKTGKPVIARIGRYGPMIQIGTKDDEEKPQFAGIPKSSSISDITLEGALKLFDLPRDLGEWEDKKVTAAIGPFGPYVKQDNTFASIPKDEDPYTIELDRAIELLTEKRKKDAEKTIAVFDEGKIKILKGRYGPYIKAGRTNVRIPKDVEATDITEEQAKELVKEAKGTKSTKKKPKKSSAKKKK